MSPCDDNVLCLGPVNASKKHTYNRWCSLDTEHSNPIHNIPLYYSVREASMQTVANKLQIHIFHFNYLYSLCFSV